MALSEIPIDASLFNSPDVEVQMSITFSAPSAHASRIINQVIG